MIRLIRPSCCLFNATTIARSSSTTSELVELASACCRSHRSETSPQMRKRIELHAWKLLSQDDPRGSHVLTLTEAVEILHVWRYFSRWWERSFEGPSDELLAASSDSDVAPVVEPHRFRKRSPSRHCDSIREQALDSPRASALDEVLE